MVEYVTTNVRMPKELHRELKQRAVEEDKSMAQVLREAAVQYMVRPQIEVIEESAEERLAAWKNDSLWEIGTDSVIADVTDGSVNHDIYLYGPLSESARAEINEE